MLKIMPSKHGTKWASVHKYGRKRKNKKKKDPNPKQTPRNASVLATEKSASELGIASQSNIASVRKMGSFACASYRKRQLEPEADSTSNSKRKRPEVPQGNGTATADVNCIVNLKALDGLLASIVCQTCAKPVSVCLFFNIFLTTGNY